jgi:glycosyltransferase involved in cell wall biosynthesis
VRIVVDYRPALRARTGVGEYIHQTIRAMAQAKTGDALTLFSTSWKDRPGPDIARELPTVRVVDRRIPVSALNFAWHRFGWPSIEAMAGGTYDVAHSPHPLLLPSRSAAQLVTIHDLYFMAHPERTSAEIRRDYPSLAKAHARRADRIIVSSRFAAGEVQRAFGLSPEKIAVCPAGAPAWATPRQEGGDPNGYLFFLGTLDARKNVGGLLAAYRQLLTRQAELPRLVMAGGTGASPDATGCLQTIASAPFAGRVEHLGYVDDDRRASLFRGARVFVLPSFEEGFGLPALEAMAAGVPVVASNRGSLPELIGDAGLLVDPDDASSIAAAIERILSEPELWHVLRRRGLDRASQFTWEQTARDVRRAYEDAVTAHAHRH